jgi:hypothetical protein
MPKARLDQIGKSIQCIILRILALDISNGDDIPFSSCRSLHKAPFSLPFSAPLQDAGASGVPDVEEENRLGVRE